MKRKSIEPKQVKSPLSMAKSTCKPHYDITVLWINIRIEHWYAVYFIWKGYVDG